MQDLKPELDRLQKEHKNDKAAFAEAQATLFKTRGINPLASCLPVVESRQQPEPMAHI